MKLDGIREKVFLDRYALKDKDGSLLEKAPEEMWKRVATVSYTHLTLPTTPYV